MLFSQIMVQFSDTVFPVLTGLTAADQVTWEVAEQAPECTSGGCRQIGSVSSSQFPNPTTHTNDSNRFHVSLYNIQSL